MSELEFHPVTMDNLKEAIALKVKPEQTQFVADNLYSVAQVGLQPSARCRVVYLDDQPVGFFAVDKGDRPGHVYIWRFMIDANHQRRGVGRRVIAKLMAELFADPAVDVVELTVVRNDGGPEPFYNKCGFRSMNECIDGEWLLEMSRAEYEAIASSARA